MDADTGGPEHEQKTPVKKIIPFIREAACLNILTSPAIRAVLPASLIPDVALAVFRTVCPIDEIPKVRHGNYIVMDHSLRLNIIEKLNCVCCSYASAVIAYVQEIGSGCGENIERIRRNFDVLL